MRTIQIGIIGVVLLALALGIPASASAQSCAFSVDIDDWSTDGLARSVGFTETVPAACAAGQAPVETWINSGLTGNRTCNPGTYNSALHSCVRQATGGATASELMYACGTWQGFSKHFWINTNGSWVDLGNRGPATLDAGNCSDPVAECAASGGTWNYSTGHCDYVNSPIVIALGPGRNVTLTSVEQGVQFDIDNDGDLDQVAWTMGNSDVAFLALDRNADGAITSGLELFGNHTVPGVGNGFTALEKLLGTRKPVVEEGDGFYEQLLFWTDRNHNGVSEPEELQPAKDVLARIGTGYQIVKRRGGHGNEFRYRGWVELRTAPGLNRSASGAEHVNRSRDAWDVFLVTR